MKYKIRKLEEEDQKVIYKYCIYCNKIVSFTGKEIVYGDIYFCDYDCYAQSYVYLHNLF